MVALPSFCYGDPADCVDWMRKQTEKKERADAKGAEVHKLRKGRRIRKKVRELMRRGG